ncbi:MAG: type II secretion system protein [Gemmatimonadota bacterium]
MRKKCTRGFTLVETLIAIVVLGLGVLPLAGVAMLSTRLLIQGRSATLAATIATSRIEDLRRAAGRVPACAAVASGSAAHSGGIVEDWSVSGGGSLRTVWLVVSYPVPGRARSDSTVTQVRCS